MELMLEGCCKYYGRQAALQDFSYCFQTGIFGLLGSNGAGKTTLMNLITDNIHRTSGRITWNGTEIVELGDTYRYAFGYMPQQQNGFSSFTVGSFLHYVGYLKGMKRRDADEEADRLLEKLNLTKQKNEKISSLSGGMKQRVLLAQAMMGDPPMLLLDEPTAGLDPQERIRIRNLISELSQNKMILLATHIVSDLECVADHVLMMKKGRLVGSGTPMELIASVRPYVREEKCSREDLSMWQKIHPFGQVLQRADGMYFRYVTEEGKTENMAEAGLEEVYMFYARHEFPA